VLTIYLVTLLHLIISYYSHPGCPGKSTVLVAWVTMFDSFVEPAHPGRLGKGM